MWILWTVSSLFIFRSVFGQCPSNFVVHDDSCYHFSHDTETWPDAVVVCSMVLDAHLVEIDSQVEENFITNNMKASSIWIGLNDLAEEGVWFWQNSKTKVSYINWHPGEPNNVGGNENCVLATKTGWYDDGCYKPKNYVCEKEVESSVVIG